jgi:hypothetical protein
MGTTGVPQADRTVDPFERFRRAVFADREVQVRLRSVSEWPAFVDAALAAADECGVELTEGDLAAARDEARRSWRERWV